MYVSVFIYLNIRLNVCGHFGSLNELFKGENENVIKGFIKMNEINFSGQIHWLRCVKKDIYYVYYYRFIYIYLQGIITILITNRMKKLSVCIKGTLCLRVSFGNCYRKNYCKFFFIILYPLNKNFFMFNIMPNFLKIS